MMRLVSVNVGTPREIGRVRGKTVLSSIYKTPVHGPVAVTPLNLDGDRQSDPTVHGGVDQAVYVYPSEHYPYWKERFPVMEMPWGTFGENFTTQGLLEEDVHIGDELFAGSAKFAITKPRFPCFKLGLRFGTQTMIKKFLDSERSGFYLRVIQVGRVEQGDEIRLNLVRPDSETIASVVRSARKRE